MLDVLQSSEYVSGLVFGVLTLLIYCCQFMYKCYLIHLQTMTESTLGKLWLDAFLNKRDPAYSNLPGLLYCIVNLFSVGNKNSSDT